MRRELSFVVGSPCSILACTTASCGGGFGLVGAFASAVSSFPPRGARGSVFSPRPWVPPLPEKPSRPNRLQRAPLYASLAEKVKTRQDCLTQDGVFASYRSLRGLRSRVRSSSSPNGSRAPALAFLRVKNAYPRTEDAPSAISLLTAAKAAARPGPNADWTAPRTRDSLGSSGASGNAPRRTC